MSKAELIEALKDEQHERCVYGTREGDGRTCDCKYNPYPFRHPFKGRGEVTGCPELRAAIRVLENEVDL